VRYLLLFTLFIFSASTYGAVVLNVLEIGGDVVATTEPGGSFNTDALTPVLSNSVLTSLSASGPNPFILVGGTTPGASPANFFLGFTSAPLSMGAGIQEFSTFNTGPVHGVFTNALVVPSLYVSGAPLGVATSTWGGETFASLGLTPGTYTWTWGAGPTADSYTVNIGAVAVPEPSVYIAGLGFGLLGFMVWRRRHHAKPVNS